MRQFILIILLLINFREQAKSQLSVSINAQSNIFSAGSTSVLAPGGGDGGILPFEVSIKGDIEWINFTKVTGIVSGIEPFYGRADGRCGSVTNIQAYNGISGAYHSNSVLMLVGVFLDDFPPSGCWGGNNDLYADQIDNEPELNRIFYIGDGLTERNTGVLQKFYVPDGATRLFIGFADAFSYKGLPGSYGDNMGSIKATINMYRRDDFASRKRAFSNELYSIVNSKLKLESDTSKYFILDLVRNKCGDDFKCNYDAYTYLCYRLERDLNLPISFFINKEIIRLCRTEKDYEKLRHRFIKNINNLSYLSDRDSTFLISLEDSDVLANSKNETHDELISSKVFIQAERIVSDIQEQDIENEKQVYYLLALISILLLGFMAVGVVYQLKKKKQLALKNKKVKEQAERLRYIDQTKSRFFANISHELRTPLTLIHGPLNTIINTSNLSNETLRMAHLAQENTVNLLRLVNSILDLSKIEGGKMMLKEDPVNLYSLIRHIVSGFESHAQANRLQLNFEFLGEERLILELDSEKVETILSNLLLNAIKFSSKNGDVFVTVEDRKKDILFTVKDTGRGISKTDLPNIFDLYFQTEMPDAPSEGGTGIGLAFSKELVELMKGKIWVESELRVGTTFFFELPRKEVLGVIDASDQVCTQDNLKPSKKTSILESIQKESTIQVFDKTILLVEDNSSLQDYIRFILDSQFNIIVVGNGKEAIDYLNSSYNSPSILRPALIVSDVMMPIMDGLQFIENLKVDPKFNQIPVIMLTARADLQDKLKALRIGVDDYLLKPFSEEELKVRIENLLNNYASRSFITLENNEELIPRPKFSQEDMEWLAMFEDYIRTNYTQQILNIPQIAHDMAMSESSLLRKLKQLTGLSPARYLQEVRLEKAMSYLNNRTYNSVSKVAFEVGYSDSRTFSRNFKSRYGKSPSDYLSQQAID